jgi:hypothetical protein
LSKVILALGIMISSVSYAQEHFLSQRTFKRSIATVIFAGLGGGILGLSTLSFEGKPQEHTSNITTGAALGVVGGLIYVLMAGGQETKGDHDVVLPKSGIGLAMITRDTTPMITWNCRF